MAQSYSNSGGTGLRHHLILIRSNANWGSGGTKHPAYLLNGSQGNDIWFDGTQTVSALYIVFDFGAPRIVDEAKWYQDSGAYSHGTWQWQGSNDDSTFTNIGSTFTLGGSTAQVHTTLNGNTTPYRYYKLLGVSGSTSNGPYTREIEFQIDALVATTPDYGNTYGSGDRTAAGITVTQSLTSSNGNVLVGRVGAPNPHLQLFVDGINRADGAPSLDALVMIVSANSGKWIQWQFPIAVVIDEVRWIQETSDTHGVWQLQGSNDGSSFTNIGSSETLGGDYMPSGHSGYTSSASSVNMCYMTLVGGHGNTTAYLYYRLAGVSGSASSNQPFIWETAFRIATPASTTNVRVTQIVAEAATENDATATIRVTQEVAEAVTEDVATGTIRVTQMYAEAVTENTGGILVVLASPLGGVNLLRGFIG